MPGAIPAPDNFPEFYLQTIMTDGTNYTYWMCATLTLENIKQRNLESRLAVVALIKKVGKPRDHIGHIMANRFVYPKIPVSPTCVIAGLWRVELKACLLYSFNIQL